MTDTSEEAKSTADPKQQQSKSSFVARVRQSFVRSKGRGGANVEALRGTSGSDFEAPGRISRGQGSTGCCGSSDESKDRFILVKGPFCFVFNDKDAPSSKYAVSLHCIKPVAKGQSNGRWIVLLQTHLGDTEYELAFHDDETANKFCAVVTTQSAVAEVEDVRKRLGHEHLLNKRSSVVYAETIAQKKIKDQPDAPITTQEIMQTVPTVY